MRLVALGQGSEEEPGVYDGPLYPRIRRADATTSVVELWPGWVYRVETMALESPVTRGLEIVSPGVYGETYGPGSSGSETPTGRMRVPGDTVWWMAEGIDEPWPIESEAQAREVAQVLIDYRFPVEWIERGSVDPGIRPPRPYDLDFRPELLPEYLPDLEAAPAGYGSTGPDSYGGPAYPRIVRVGAETVVAWSPDAIAVRPTAEMETQRGGPRPGVYPGVVEGAGAWYPRAGWSQSGTRLHAATVKQLGDAWTWLALPADLLAQLETLEDRSLQVVEVWEPLQVHYRDIGLRYDPVTGIWWWYDSRPVEAHEMPLAEAVPLSDIGNPDWGRAALAPYGGDPALDVWPYPSPAEPHDPWEEAPPVVVGPGHPDPDDPDVWVLPPEDPAPPEPIPCMMVATGAVGVIDPETGWCVDADGVPLPPTDEPGPGVPGGGGAVPPPPPPPPASEAGRGALWLGLGAAALALFRRRRR